MYIQAPKELNLPTDTVLRVVKPLYGVPESGLHWHLTYVGHHTGTLRMSRARADPCVLLKHRDGELVGLVILQVDDSFGFGDQQFLAAEESTGDEFISKPRTWLTSDPIEFNGITIREKVPNIFIEQCSKVQPITIPTTQAAFVSKRAMIQ